MVALLFGLPLLRVPAPARSSPWSSGAVGLSSLGSLFGLLTVMGRRQAALPILVLPLVSPVVIGGDPGHRRRSRRAAPTASPAGSACWLAFDAAFLATGYLVYGHLLED